MHKTLIATIALLIPLGVAHAEETRHWGPEEAPRLVADRFALELGVLVAGLDTQLRVDEDADNPGTQFSAEDDLGLADMEVAVIPEITLLPGKRHVIRINGFSIRRRATTTLERDILYEGDLYEVGDEVSSNLDLKLVAATYGYKFLSSPNYSLGLSVGVQVVDFTTKAQVRGEAPVNPTGETAPVPVLGAEGMYAFSRCCAVEGRVQYSEVSTDDLEGSYINARLAFTWQYNPHLAIGLGYQSMKLEAESFADDSAGLVHFKIQGPTLFARASL